MHPHTRRNIRDAALILGGGTAAALGAFIGGYLYYQTARTDIEAEPASWRDHPCDAGYENCPAVAYPPKVRPFLVPAGGDTYWPPIPDEADVIEPRAANDQPECWSVIFPGGAMFGDCYKPRPDWTYDPPLPPRRPDVIPERDS